MNHQEDEDGEWVPLDRSNNDKDGSDDIDGGAKRQSHAKVEIPATARSRRTTRSSGSFSNRNSSQWRNWRNSKSSSQPCSSSTSTSQSSTSTVLQQIRNRHETNSRVKKTFVHQPLSIFPRRFLYHLIREIWACHPFVRWGKIDPI